MVKQEAQYHGETRGAISWWKKRRNIMVKQEFLLCFIIHISIDVDTNALFYYNNVSPTSVVGDLTDLGYPIYTLWFLWLSNLLILSWWRLFQKLIVCTNLDIYGFLFFSHILRIYLLLLIKAYYISD